MALIKQRDPWYGPDSPPEGKLFGFAVIASVAFMIGFLRWAWGNEEDQVTPTNAHYW